MVKIYFCFYTLELNCVPSLIYKPFIIYKLNPFKCSLYVEFTCTKGFPAGSNSKVSVCNTRDLGSIPESGRSPGEGNGNSLWYFCLGNAMDRGAWRAAVHEVTKSNTTKQLAHRIHTLLVLNTVRKGIEVLYHYKDR